MNPGGGNGGPDGFRAVYLEYGRMVRSVLYNICGGSELDDLAQETFVKIWKGLDGFRNEAGLKTWIYRIAVNTALDHCRRRERDFASELPDEISGGFGGEPEAVYRDLVEKGLRRLSPEQRAVVVLAVFEDVPLKEAALALDVPEGTVKSRLHGARRELAAFLKENGVAR